MSLAESDLSINGQRLYEALESLGRIGQYRDSTSGLVGVCRLALTEADGEARAHVVSEMRALGLDVTVDPIGNVFARRAGKRNDLRPVMMGSHIDSVATAGRFDGCLGVLGGLEVVRTLNEASRQTTRPIVVAFFTEEEGARFGTDMLGSAVATGRIGLHEAYALKDKHGKTVKAELEALGFAGHAALPLPPPHAYLELHIEQGPVLRQSGHDIGVVTGVQGISWQRVEITGKSAHAGTTPMSLRADAGVAASRINVFLRDMVRSGTYGADFRATMGLIETRPGLVNVVPGYVTATVDLRNPDDGALARAESALVAQYERIAREENVTIRHQQTARTPVVAFDTSVQKTIASACSRLGLNQTSIISGAGHDAQEMSRIAKTAMVFVPGEHDGISHNPREYSTLSQCQNGANVLLSTLLSLANEEEGL